MSGSTLGSANEIILILLLLPPSFALLSTLRILVLVFPALSPGQEDVRFVVV